MDTVLTSSGFALTLRRPQVFLVGQERRTCFKLQAAGKKPLSTASQFVFRPWTNLEFPKADYGDDIVMTEPGNFSISKDCRRGKNLVLKFKFNNKKNDKETLKISFTYHDEINNRDYTFEEKSFENGDCKKFFKSNNFSQRRIL